MATEYNDETKVWHYSGSVRDRNLVLVGMRSTEMSLSREAHAIGERVGHAAYPAGMMKGVVVGYEVDGFNRLRY
jgi:hypothetical protein